MTFFQKETTGKVLYEWDPAAKGLGIRQNRNGTTVYVFKCGGKSKMFWITISSTESMTILQARLLAKRMRTLAKSGVDPSIALSENDPSTIIERVLNEHSGKKKKMYTLGEFSKVFITRHAKEWKKSWKYDQQRMIYLKPLWNTPLSLVTRGDIESIHKQISKKGAITTANRVTQQIRVMFRYAIEWGFLPENHINPAKNIRMNKLQSRDRFITKEERPRLDAILDVYPDLRIKTAIRMILLMGYRHQEVCKMRWEYFDSELSSICLPDTKNGKPHIMPIPEVLKPDLKKLRETKGPFVFPGRFPGTCMGHLDHPWQKIRIEAGIPDVRIHDLRRTFASDCIRNGVDLYTISRLLNHSAAYITSVYAKHDIEPLRDILNNNASRRAGRAPGPSLKVVSIMDYWERSNRT